ncbi:DUF2989 domain-containing protein [Vibrio sp. SCSIO 43136]|uniref:DUF2989 domain-containing protein n=1 Tax=Vibrio sp. SCSIO 43136 TaxID=2819101 RepID=UPI00207532AF|nr:DUF2989 domain-containing protein [Vibrio sp. SCSIO 43136]USD66056.1 DUF2989 domain-containing protein [Vibrio sp. SCSIO 43136]
MTRNQLLIIIATLIPLSGCLESRKNTDELCESNPPLRCEKLNMRDGQCRIPRTDLIWHRFDALRNNTVEKQLKEYELLHEYQQCLELAAQIQPINQSNVKERRFNALVHTYDEQKRIKQELGQSTNPRAYYFLWTQGDENAKRAFLQLEGTPALESADMQLALASYYVGRDELKTVKLLENALKLTPTGELNTDIIKSLASTNQTARRYEHAYIWAMVGKEFDLPITSERNLQRLYAFSEEKRSNLDAIAMKIASAVKEGGYKPELLPDSADLQ